MRIETNEEKNMVTMFVSSWEEYFEALEAAPEVAVVPEFDMGIDHCDDDDFAF